MLTQNKGFSDTTITFINITDDKQYICVSFLDTIRSDVQKIGFDIPKVHEYLGYFKKHIIREFETALKNIIK